MSSPVTICDCRVFPPTIAGEVWRWSDYAEREGTRSVPRYLEEHAERLRSKYLAFIHDLGETRIAGRRLVEHLDRGNGFSFWWLTQLAEKSPLKSPRLYTCLRLLALEEMILERRPPAIRLRSADSELAQAMRKLCEQLAIPFSWKREPDPTGGWSARRIYRELPAPTRALATFVRHLASAWPLRRVNRRTWFGGEKTSFFCSYFIHLDKASCARGQFHSRQWGILPAALNARGVRSNWIQHFLQSPEVPNAERGVDWATRFNADADRQGHHAFLDSHLSWSVVGRALSSWIWLLRVAFRLRTIGNAFVPNGSAVWLWPVLRDDWQTSLAGPVAIQNCLLVALFDEVFRELPRQPRGFYLCENQAWERAMLAAWRRRGHGEITGVIHATVPYWHLYYFDDSRTWGARGTGAMPMPDRLAVNGSVARRAFEGQGYPSNEIVDVEALRYLSFANTFEGSAIRGVMDARNRSATDFSGIDILILGDMIPTAMRAFLRMVEEAVPLLPPNSRLTFKPHPGYRVRLADYPGLSARETNDALDRILGEYDVAVAANSTSASVDAYMAGIPVIIMLDGASLNLSPLRGQPGVSFVSSPEELSAAIRAAGNATESAPRNDMFFLDPELPRWMRLVGAGGNGL